MNIKRIISFISAAVMVLSFMPALASDTSMPLRPDHAVGSNIKDSSGTIYMITSDYQRRPYTSAGAFLSYGFNNWGSVSDATNNDLQLPVGSFIPPQDGKIICSDRGADKGTCYIITNSAKVGFPTELVFKGQGYSFSRALYGDVSFLQQSSIIQSATEPHRQGTLINQGGTVYLVGPQSLRGFPDINVFNSWGYSMADVVPANSADVSMPINAVISTRTPGSLNPNVTVIVPAGAQAQGTLESDSPSGTITPGTDKVLLKFSITAPSTNSAVLRKLAFNFGTIPSGALSNLKLILDTSKTVVGSYSSSVVSGTVTMDVVGGITISPSSSAHLILQADVSSSVGSFTVTPSLIQVWGGDAGNPQISPVSGVPLSGSALTVIQNIAPLQITSQTGSETWPVGSTQTIRWTGGNSTDKINIFLGSSTGMVGCPNCSGSAIALNVPNTGSYTFNVTALGDADQGLVGKQWYVYVRNATTVGYDSYSANKVYITNDTFISVNTPHGGEVWTKGVPQNIQFSSNGVSSIKIYLVPYIACLYSTPACAVSQPLPYLIVANAGNNGNTYVTVSLDTTGHEVPAGQYLVEITDSSGAIAGFSKGAIILQ